MSKPLIVIAEPDETYIVPLELKFAEDLDETADIEIITDSEYLSEYFSVPKKLDILVVDEEFYNPDFKKHNIGSIFILSENPGGTEDIEDGVRRVFKYSNIKGIFSEIVSASLGELAHIGHEEKKSQIVLVYSGIGGSGKTTVAVGIAACLAQASRRTIYIDAEHCQTFHRYLQNKAVIPNQNCFGLYKKNSAEFQNLKYHIRKEGFDYLPPFGASLSALSIDFTAYGNLIAEIKASGEYDYIIVDCDSTLSDEKAGLLAQADRVLILVNQDNYSLFKTNVLLNNIDSKNRDKYFFICNRYERNRENELSKQSRFLVSEYIELVSGIDTMSADELTKIEGFQKTAYVLI